MKKIIIAGIFAASLSITACEKNFDPVLTGVLSPANFPKTEADFKLYTLQAYKPFGSKWDIVTLNTKTCSSVRNTDIWPCLTSPRIR